MLLQLRSVLSRRVTPISGRRIAGAALCATCACATPLLAQDRMVRRYAAGQGFGGAPVAALAQDGRGFIWIGGEDGLYRYDGTAFRKWAPTLIDGPVRAIATHGDDRVVAVTERGRLYEVVGNGARELAVPLPVANAHANTLAFDAHGTLWLVRGGRIAAYGSSWRVLPEELFDGAAPRLVRATPRGGIGVATSNAIWELEAGTPPVRRLRAQRTPDFAFLADGGLAVVDTALRIVSGGVERAVDPFRRSSVQPRAIALAERAGTVWVAYDRFLMALRPDRPPEVLGPERGIESGGPLLVDREGSLWMGAFTALLQYPEPETRIWNERSGVHSQHTRFIARSGRSVVVTTWQGTVLIEPDRGTSRWMREWHSQAQVCADGAGGVWLATPDGVIRTEDGDVASRHDAGNGSLHCTRGARGVWLWTGDRLYRGDRAGLVPVASPPLPSHVQPVASLAEGADREIWLGGAAAACRGTLAGNRIASWNCDTLPDAGDVLAFARTSGGAMLAATSRGGVHEYVAEGWKQASLDALLPSRALLNLVPSPAGGLWVLGHGLAWRVEETTPGAWTVRERLGEWHGLPLEGGRDLHEDEDGRLWITTSLGVLEVPGSVRALPPSAPVVELVEALVDDEPVTLDGDVELPYHRNRLELRFAVLSFRDPGRLRYQVRLSPGEQWRPAAGRPWFRWIDLPARTHRAELRASLDGEHWTARPAALSFQVLPPWYRTRGATAGFAIAVLLLLWSGYRARVGYLVGLERERTRIAMDLHDEMGSGLGSIGILSGILAGDTGGARGRDLAGRIARTAEDLGGSLSGIIWSLDARPSRLAELASRLADSAVNLLTAQGIAFHADFPESWPDDPLSPRARRNLMLLGLEALHNAARHSGARAVTLTFRDAGPYWEMRVADDGVGFDEATLSRRGHGLDTMRRRAREIEASIAWQSRPHGGTAVTVAFGTRAVRARRSVLYRATHRLVPAGGGHRSPGRTNGGSNPPGDGAA